MKKQIPFSIFLLFSILHLSGAQHPGKGYALKADNGKFIGTDKRCHGQFSINYSRVKKSSVFILEQKGQFQHLVPQCGSPITSNPETRSILLGGFVNHEEILNLIQVGNNAFLLINSKGLYVNVDRQNNLFFGSYNAESVGRFRLIPAEAIEVSESGFTSDQSITIILAISIILLGIVLFRLGYKKIGLLILSIGAFSIRLAVIRFDPYLNNWDEAFHALVAKNMLDNPFKPMLYVHPVLPYDRFDWHQNHIWFHKQPLFMWQMALSMKSFGTNEFAVRLPSVILGTLMVLLVYRIGSLTINETVGIIGAGLLAASNFLLELTVGGIFTDHADVSFVFYVTASIWAWCEYERSNARIWLLLIGLFSGFAILVKWVIGLLVYAGWGISLLVKVRKLKDLLSFKPLLFSLMITLVVALPWQLYILINHPEESISSYIDFSRHFTMPVEGHSGNAWFHFNRMKRLYGLPHFIVLISLIAFFTYLKKNTFRWAFFTMIVFTYLFFSLAVMKNSSFTFVVSSLIFLAIASLLTKIFQFIKTLFDKSSLHISARIEMVYQLVFTGILVFYSFRYKAMESNHTMLEKDMYSYRAIKRTNTDAFRKIKQSGKVGNLVLFNCSNWDQISAMFYLNDVTAYDRIPEAREVIKMLQEGHRLAMMDSRNLPDYIINNQDILIIRANYIIAR